METESTTSISVSVSLQAPIITIWEFWTSPQHITKWYQASEDWHAPFAENDLRVGGKFKTTMAAKDKSFQFDFGGTYTKIVDYKTIEYTLDDDRKVSVHFEEGADSTTITQLFEPEKENTIEMQQFGWQAILNSFKSYLEKS